MKYAVIVIEKWAKTNKSQKKNKWQRRGNVFNIKEMKRQIKCNFGLSGDQKLKSVLICSICNDVAKEATAGEV